MQTGDSFRLVMRRGPQPNQVFELRDEALSLGRDITNTLVINDREVSRHHLRFTRGADGYTVEDLGSTNGTFINGKRVTGAILLKNGDMIGLGETVTLGFELVRAGSAPATAQTPNYQPTQPQQPPSASAYQPPAGSPPAQPAPSADPYRPATPPYTDPYAPQGQAAPYSDPYQAPAGADAQYYQPQGYGAPPPPGYDYDPYAMREPATNNTTRMILFGCLGLLMFCCCISVVGFVAIDQLNLYCQIPLFNDILEALGLISCAVAGG